MEPRSHGESVQPKEQTFTTARNDKSVAFFSINNAHRLSYMNAMTKRKQKWRSPANAKFPVRYIWNNTIIYNMIYMCTIASQSW